MMAAGGTGIDTTARAGEMLAALRSGAVSAVELTQAHLDRIDGVGASLNAFVVVDHEGALSAARAIDRRRAAGEDVGALAGLPISVKDSIDAAGLRSTHGRLSDSYVASTDAPAVRRLREAGCVVLGKTNVPVYLASHETSNEAFGRTVNPWDAARSSGGSSGGSSAAVAGGLAVADLGSDLAGSLRLPASWCGLSGHRPSNGIVSKLGNLPWPQGGLLEPHVSSVGPLTRHAADADLFLRAMIGVEGPDSRGWRIELPPPRITALSEARVAVWLDDPSCPTDAETRAAIVQFAAALGTAGAHVTLLDDAPVGGPADLELFRRLQAGEVVHGFDDEMWAYHLSVAARPDDSDEVRFSRAVVQPFRSAMDDLEKQHAAMRRWQRMFETVDVVLAPAVGRAATRFGEHPDGRTAIGGREYSTEVLFAWNRMSSIGKLPSTMLALGPGAHTGLPIGVQVLGPYLEDFTPLRFAVEAERAGLAGFRAAPGWS
ncbi:amidase family protein [Subtercola frigoramans]|uniref:Amidase n=1 Tax=Subtercola frigoramans TaxID=120298 RepID=A0ABS2L311_9MICO|nr:amidase family protein [Subtercola frigoramans]MBM7471125.1 amidase [Subtercola frigoramans]